MAPPTAELISPGEPGCGGCAPLESAARTGTTGPMLCLNPGPGSGGLQGCNHSELKSGSCHSLSDIKCACWNIAGVYKRTSKLDVLIKSDFDINYMSG